MKIFKVFLTFFLVFITNFNCVLGGSSDTLRISDFGRLYQKQLIKIPSDITWLPSSTKFSFKLNNKLFLYNENNEKKIILSLKKLNNKIVHLNNLKFSQFPDFKWLSESKIFLYQNNFNGIYNIQKDSLVQAFFLPENASNVNYFENKLLAFTKDNSLYYQKWGKEANIVAKSHKDYIKYGYKVHRSEFGINKGIFWSPDGNYLAFYKKDARKVKSYPLLNYDSLPPAVEYIKYPMAGKNIPEVSLQIYNLNKKTTITLNTGKKDKNYLTSITWGPQEKYIYLGLLNRGQDTLKVNKYNVHNGELEKTLFTEKDRKYVEPENPLYFRPEHPHQFVWLSQRSGYKHLYLYNKEGQLIKQLTSGKWEVTDFKGFTENGNKLLFQSNRKHPLERHNYVFDINKKQLQIVSSQQGYHQSFLDPEGNQVVTLHSDLKTPSILRYKNLNNGNKNFIHETSKVLPFSEFNTQIDSFYIKDDQKLYSRTIFPGNFDEDKQYPVILYVYGGPMFQMVQKRWSGGRDLFLYYMAKKGYIVHTLDNRGTAGRGRNFEQEIFGQLGEKEVKDQVKGLKKLMQNEWVDTARIGVYGWSYGGYLTLKLLNAYSHIFDAGIAGAPVTDWKFYEAFYTERYMNKPINNKKGYKKSSVINEVSKLNKPLLLIHSNKDKVVLEQHSKKFVDQCVKKSKQLDYFQYTGEGHHIKGKKKLHLYHKIEAFWNKNLKN